MKEDNNSLSKEDFNLEVKYQEFDIIYSIGKGLGEHEVKKWVVTGRVLDSSSESRCFDYHLMMYPISKFIVQNKHTTLDKLRNTDFISNDTLKLIEFKDAQLEKFYSEYKEKLKENVI